MIVMAVSVLFFSFMILMMAQFDLDQLFKNQYPLDDLKPHKIVLICSNLSIALFLCLISRWKSDIT